ncbi:uncharacterized protein LOC107776191 [Nicotiana tabacum]|uniref:Uncharacterized protein LOC107776191 n=1 Tax=Nicotiana tabacum TaxID=4097 RepID=A0AC58SX14_TOBAC
MLLEFSKSVGGCMSDHPKRVKFLKDPHGCGSYLESPPNIGCKDKFESDDMDIHRDHILGWMKELWNKRRGQLHTKYVKGKPIQEVLKNVPKGVDKKQWEWLVKEHFSTESFQAQIKELVQSEPSLPNIEIVEKCFGPQSRSHVFGFGGWIKGERFERWNYLKN